MSTRIGVISDTHGLLRPEALAALRDSELILHAGDVGRPQVLDELALRAPVRAVRGNVDGGLWAHELPMTESLALDGTLIYMIHIREDLDMDPAGAGYAVVVTGHSHRPAIEREAGVLYLNPGSAGPRRFSLPVTVARLTVDDGAVAAELVHLDV